MWITLRGSPARVNIVYNYMRDICADSSIWKYSTAAARGEFCAGGLTRDTIREYSTARVCAGGFARDS